MTLSLTEKASAPASVVIKARLVQKIDPDVSNRLERFMQANPEMNDYYTALVMKHPEQAVRSFMLFKMLRHETDRYRPVSKF